MPLEIIRTHDRIKLSAKEVETIIAEHVALQTGRDVSAVEVHVGRNEFGQVTVYLAHQDQSS